MVDMNDMIMTDSPIRFPGLFGDWTFTASSKAINIGHGCTGTASSLPWASFWRCCWH